MFGNLLSINPPYPELLIDISREHKANSNYSDTGYPYIHNYGTMGGGTSYACIAANLKSPELYYNPWYVSGAQQGAEYSQLKTGVFHFTKLGVKQTFQQADMGCNISDFKGFGSKLGIFISSDKSFNQLDSKPNVKIIDNSNGSYPQGLQKLQPGMNVWDLTNEPVNIHPEEGKRGAFVSFPNSWWDTDESGNPVVTPCDIYVVFFPVLDESQCNGYGEYLCPRFNDSSWNKKVEEIVLSDDGLTVDTTLATDAYDLLYSPTPYYSDEYIIVYSPEFLNVYSSTNTDIIFEALTYSDSGGYSLLHSETLGSTDGQNAPFYGCVIFKENHTSFINQIRFLSKGEFTMLPYNNDRFTVAVTGDTNNYGRLMISETEHFHDKSELQTLISKCKNTLSGSNSLLYRNEVNDGMQKIGLHGIRFATTSATITDNSFKACLTNGGLETTESRKSIVSYLDGRVLQTNDYGDYELLYKNIVMSVVLLKNEITAEDCVDTGSLLFASRSARNNFSGQLYYLVGFKDRLTPWQIAYQIKQMN